MIDLKLIRESTDTIRDSIQKRGLSLDIDAFLSLDKDRRELIEKIEALRATRNSVSKEIPTLAADERAQKIAQMKTLGETVTLLEGQLEIIQKQWEDMYYAFPNVLDPSAAIGASDEENLHESSFLSPTVFDFEPKAHYEIGAQKGWIDTEKGAEISGARFWYLKGDLVLLQFAIVQFTLSRLVSKGFLPILPPVLVKEPAMFGTGFFPAGEDGIYRVNPNEDDLFLVGTAEVPVTSYHAGEVLDLETPKMYAGYSSCFRREAGSAGKDMKGILRGHQFDKVEMVVFCRPEDSVAMHDMMVAMEEEIWQALGIPYNKMNVCSGDLGNPAMKKYDLEAWMPGQGKYREITSCSNVGEFQARRLGVKCKNTNGETVFAHTLNGTVIALSRCLIAIIENYQTKNGDVAIPEVLQPFMAGKTQI